MIKYVLNGDIIEQGESTTILESASRQGIKIPTLCNNEHLTPFGGCRLCLVDVATERNPDMKKLMPACTAKIGEGLIVDTHSEKVIEARRFILSMLISRSPKAEVLRLLAKEIGLSPAQLALLWVKDQEGITAPLAGARTLEQLEDVLAVLEMTLTDEMRAACDELVPPGTNVANFRNTALWGQQKTDLPWGDGSPRL